MVPTGTGGGSVRRSLAGEHPINSTADVSPPLLGPDFIVLITLTDCELPVFVPCKALEVKDESVLCCARKLELNDDELVNGFLGIGGRSTSVECPPTSTKLIWKYIKEFC